jgi:formylglycine-generating enzyme required for sulfatase activity
MSPPSSPQRAGERMVIKIKGVEYAFRWCPSGKFLMGSPESEKQRSAGERHHQVTLTRGFWMLETEVTQLMWESVMGSNPSNFKGLTLPVESVSWDDCQEFITKLNTHLADTPAAPKGFKFALPTESQWEYACRAGTTTAYHFGGTLTKEQANFDGSNIIGKTTEVGSYPANAWGLERVKIWS